MKILGSYRKVGRWFAAEVPLLLINTQAHTKKELAEMIEDAVQLIVDDPSFKPIVTILHSGELVIGAKKNSAILAAAALRQQRGASHKSIREVAKELGSNSPTSYSRYESGAVSLSVDKFSQLLTAINGSEPVLTVMPKQ